MPGAAFWGATASAYAGTLITFATPTYAKVGDVVLAVIVAPSSAAIATPAGWDLMAAQAVAGTVNMKAWLFRRVVVEGEPASHAFTTSAALAPNPIGLALLYRYAHPTAAIVGAAATLVDPTATVYTPPTFALTTFTDVVLNVFYSKDPAATNDVAAADEAKRGATVHGDVGDGTSGGSLYVRELHPEATPAAVAASITWSTSAVGLAATFAFAATAVPQAVTVPYDIPGAIGLVSVGI